MTYPKVAEIIRYMETDWELGQSDRGRDGYSYWLQQNGLGKGGPTIDVHSRTFRAMYQKGLIKSTGWNFPTQRFVLVKEEVKP